MPELHDAEVFGLVALALVFAVGIWIAVDVWRHDR